MPLGCEAEEKAAPQDSGLVKQKHFLCGAEKNFLLHGNVQLLPYATVVV